MKCRLFGLSTVTLSALTLTFALGCADGDETVAVAETASDQNETSREERLRQAAERARERQQEVDDADDRRAGGARSSDQRPSRTSDDQSDQVFIVAEPSLLDLGEIPTNSSRSGTVTLRNVSDRPVTVSTSRTSCGCTVANVPTGQAIQPGESVEVEVSLRASARTEVLSKTVTFMFEEQDPLQMTVRGQAIAFVTLEPSVLTPGDSRNETVKIRSADGEPFRITSMHPPIARDFATDEPQSEYELEISWDQWEEHNRSRRVLFYVDHPKTSMVTGTVRIPADDRSASRGASADDPLSRERPSSRGDDSRRGAANLPTMVQQGRTDAFLVELESGIDVETTDQAGMTLLGIAARQGHVEIMRALLDAGADPHASDRVGRTVLMSAAQSKNRDALQMILDTGVDVDARDRAMGNTALSWAAGFSDPDSIRLLLDHGARIDVVGDTTGFTPLTMAAGFGQAEAVHILVEAGADVNSADFAQGATPIMHAIRTGRHANVMALIEHGADLEARDNSGKTALLWAANTSVVNVDLIRSIVEAGADLEATDGDGHSAVELAERRSDDRAKAVVEYLKEVMGD